MLRKALFPVLMTFSLAAMAQDSAFLARISRSLSAYADANPVEKVYLHLDRSYYYPGDTIWLKAYVVAGNDHQLSAITSFLLSAAY